MSIADTTREIVGLTAAVTAAPFDVPTAWKAVRLIAHKIGAVLDFDAENRALVKSIRPGPDVGTDDNGDFLYRSNADPVKAPSERGLAESPRTAQVFRPSFAGRVNNTDKLETAGRTPRSGP